jgi:hypothetical protein
VSRISLAARQALKDQQKMAPVSHARCESTLPLTLSLSDSEPKVFIRWRASGARPNTKDFFLALFFLAIALRRRPMAVGRSRRELEGDPHQPPVGQFFLALFAATRGAIGPRPPAPLS